MNHVDAPSTNLSLAVKALMNNSSGTIEEIAREVLVGVACFLQDQGAESECGGLNSVEGVGKAASQEYQEVIDLRAYFDQKERNRDKKV
jgi:hypothetical protein